MTFIQTAILSPREERENQVDNAEFEPGPLAWKASTLSFVAWPLRLGLRHLSWNVFTFSIKINFKFFFDLSQKFVKIFSSFPFCWKADSKNFLFEKTFFVKETKFEVSSCGSGCVWFMLPSTLMLFLRDDYNVQGRARSGSSYWIHFLAWSGSTNHWWDWSG